MKNIKNITKKYSVLILMVAILVIASPSFAMAQSADGDIWVGSSDGDIWTGSSDGDIWVGSSDGDIWTGSSDGDIWVNTTSGSTRTSGGTSVYVPTTTYTYSSSPSTYYYGGSTYAGTYSYTPNHVYYVGGGYPPITTYIYQPTQPVYPTSSTLDGSCYVSASNVSAGSVITWSATATGGNGSYSYYWSGDDSLSGTGSSISRIYNYSGTKNASVTITSNGQSITRSCSTYVGSGNQVLSYTDTNDTLSGVYLSDVPYTGAGDTMKVILFTLSLILWSGALAYMFLKRKVNMEKVFASLSISGVESKKESKGISETFSDRISSDNDAISRVVEYARNNKVILSNDATMKLVKLARLGKTNANQVIRKMSSNDWVTVGEKDIEKYL